MDLKPCLYLVLCQGEDKTLFKFDTDDHNTMYVFECFTRSLRLCFTFKSSLTSRCSTHSNCAFEE